MPSGPLPDSMVNEFHRKWPDLIEVTKRIASVHKEIFQSSKVGAEVGTIYIDSPTMLFRLPWTSCIGTT